LHDRPAGGRLTAHEQRDADDTFIAGDGNFRRRAIFHDIEQRDDRGGRTIHVAQGNTRLVEHRTQGHFDVFETRQPALQIGLGQRGQEFCFGSGAVTISGNCYTVNR
jgi:hypothetical protein